MMNLLRSLKHRLSRDKARQEPLLSDAQAAELVAAISPPEPPRQARGRVIKSARRPEYKPHNGRGGGRIVKTMPRELQKIKQAQEKVEDD